MRLIDAEKVDFNEVFKGQSDFAKDTREAAQSLLDAQPTVEREPKWILCSERLPEYEGEFYPALHVTTTAGKVEWGFYRADGNEWYLYNEYTEEWEMVNLYKIVAWMPLPEPYKLN